MVTDLAVSTNKKRITNTRAYLVFFEKCFYL